MIANTPDGPVFVPPVAGHRASNSSKPLHPTQPRLRPGLFSLPGVARKWRSQVEWLAHAPLAIKAGLSPDIVAELKLSKRPTNMGAEETLVFDFVTELTTRKELSDETFERARKLFRDEQLVDLTAVTGYYELVAMLLALGDENVPPGKEPPFKVGEP
jgi:4-carboxymuconolactone decarboxylase